jgi:uncharacterized membrane protein
MLMLLHKLWFKYIITHYYFLIKSFWYILLFNI